ncbi:DUF4282 domain-containing protein [Cucumibacter marinus]|uniref:DUF4282 domain-containing protein n=1 Tax=Cucumibacter marinus TaxID=1121252 RepID=UPI00040B2969|nr:DUF4282 domain-containing protein [Cucumibacter marinus]
MTPDDLKKLSTSPTLFNLDRLIGPRIIKLFYLLGLGAIVLWAVSHLFATFGTSFGAGLWGLLEIAVFGLLAFVVLRLVCEGLIVFFRANAKVLDAETVQPQPQTSIFDDVRDALEELAEEEEEPAQIPDNSSKPAARTAAKPASRASAAKTSARSTAKTATRAKTSPAAKGPAKASGSSAPKAPAKRGPASKSGTARKTSTARKSSPSDKA